MHRLRRSLLSVSSRSVAVLAAVIITTHARVLRAQETTDIDVPAGSAIQVGDGYFTLGKVEPARNRCVDFEPRRDTTAGQRSDLNILEATSKSDVGFALALSLSAMYSGVGSRYDGKADLYHQSKISNSGRSLLVKGVSRNAEISGAGWRLTQPARDQLLTRGLSGFYAQCGHMFASSIRTGAEVWGVINFSSSSQETVDSASAFVEAQGLGWSAKGDLEATVRQKFEGTQMEVRYTQVGGSGGQLATGWETLVSSAANVAGIARDHPVPLTFRLMTYDAYVRPLLDSVSRRDSVHFPNLDDLEPLRADLGAFASILEDAAFAISNAGQFVYGRGITERDVETVRQHALSLFQKVQAAADACLGSQADSCTSPFGGRAADSAFVLRQRLPLRIRTAQALERWWSASDLEQAIEHDLRVFATRTCSAPAAEYCVTLSAEATAVPQPTAPTASNPAAGKDWQYLALADFGNSCSVTSDNTPQDADGRPAVIWACNNRWNQSFEVTKSGALVTNWCAGSCDFWGTAKLKEWPARKTNSRLCLTWPEYRAGATVTYAKCKNGKSPSERQKWVYNTFGGGWLRPLVIPRDGPLLCLGVKDNRNANWQPLELQVCDEARKTSTMQRWTFQDI